jgi:hypothetical protein
VNVKRVHQVFIVLVVQVIHMLTFLTQVIIVKQATTALQDLKPQIQLLVQRVMLVLRVQSRWCCVRLVLTKIKRLNLHVKYVPKEIFVMEQTRLCMPLVLKEVIVLRALSSEANILVLLELIAHQLVYIKRVNARNAQMVITVSSEDKHHKQQRF